MVIANVENNHKIPSPDCSGNPFFCCLSEAEDDKKRLQRKAGNSS